MPRYLTQHTLACLTRQGAEALAQRMTAGGLAHAERVLVNMLEGKMFVEFRANSRAAEESAVVTRFNKEVVVLSTIVSVGTAYLQILASQDHLRINRENLAAAAQAQVAL